MAPGFFRRLAAHDEAMRQRIAQMRSGSNEIVGEAPIARPVFQIAANERGQRFGRVRRQQQGWWVGLPGRVNNTDGRVLAA